MQKVLIIIGILILLAGIFWPFVSKISLGKLPGDIIIDKPGFKFYFPITTMILISALISLIIYFFRK